jgi:hypothetical protein
MRKTRPGRRPEASTGPVSTGVAGILALTLLGSFFLPWLSFLGTPVAAHEIRERLRGPHRLISAFTEGSQVSLDYTLSIFLWAVPLAAALVLIACLLPRLRGAPLWSAVLAGLAGLAGTAAFLFLRIELRGYPFQRLEEGAWLALVAGIGLLAVAALRIGRALRGT